MVGMSKPPEGVLCGESVPTGSEQDEMEESKIKFIMNQLKERGEPWIGMKESERREKALEIYNGDI